MTYVRLEQTGVIPEVTTPDPKGELERWKWGIARELAALRGDCADSQWRANMLVFAQHDIIAAAFKAGSARADVVASLAEQFDAIEDNPAPPATLEGYRLAVALAVGTATKGKQTAIRALRFAMKNSARLESDFKAGTTVEFTAEWMAQNFKDMLEHKRAKEAKAVEEHRAAKAAWLAESGNMPMGINAEKAAKLAKAEKFTNVKIDENPVASLQAPAKAPPLQSVQKLPWGLPAPPAARQTLTLQSRKNAPTRSVVVEVKRNRKRTVAQ